MLSAFLAALALAGAWLAPLEAEAARAVDQTGRAVEVELPARRIVSLVPSVTEIAFAIGAQDRLVGVTDFCDYPAEAKTKPSVGGMLAPSLEILATLKPDLVVATSAGNRQETYAQIERMRVPVYLVDPTTVAGVLDLVSRVGHLTGHEAAAARLAASLDARVRALTSRLADRPRPRVLYVLWPDPLIVPGRGALVSELLSLAGGASVTADVKEQYPRYGLEAAIARSPEIILLASHNPGHGPLAREKWARFSGLPAVKAGRLYTVDGSVMHRYGPRVVDGLEQLARLIHPEAFP